MTEPSVIRVERGVSALDAAFQEHPKVKAGRNERSKRTIKAKLKDSRIPARVEDSTNVSSGAYDAILESMRSEHAELGRLIGFLERRRYS